MTTIPFTVDQLIHLAKVGSDTLSEQATRTKSASWEGILPGSESETFEEIENVLRQRFFDGIIVPDIA